MNRESFPPQTVVAEIEGRKVTAEEMNQFVAAMVGQLPQFFERDPKEFTRQLALLLKLAKIAEAEKLEEKAPFKQRLEYTRANVLMQSLMDYKLNGVALTEDQIQGAYEASKPDYTQSFTKVLFVAYGADGKPRTQAEAKAKIEELRKRAVGGEDFPKLIKENSEDPMTRDKNGDYPPLTRRDAVPEQVKFPVLLLKPGEYSQPIQQPSGYYLFRLEKMEVKPLKDVRNEIEGSFRQEAFRKWFEGVRAGIDVKFLNEDYFKPNPNAAVPMPGLPPGVKPPKP